jgi:hypothetical protein
MQPYDEGKPQSSMKQTCFFTMSKNSRQDHSHNSSYSMTGKNIQCIIYFLKLSS